LPPYKINGVIGGVFDVKIDIYKILARSQARKGESHCRQKHQQRSESEFSVVHNTLILGIDNLI
jgi:hypothetical protein